MGVMRILQCVRLKQERLEDAKGVIKSCKSKGRQHNDQKTNHDLHNTTQKT